eukprot:3919266-Prymnesium_polylepis.1
MDALLEPCAAAVGQQHAQQPRRLVIAPLGLAPQRAVDGGRVAHPFAQHRGRAATRCAALAVLLGCKEGAAHQAARHAVPCALPLDLVLHRADGHLCHVGGHLCHVGSLSVSRGQPLCV